MSEKILEWDVKIQTTKQKQTFNTKNIWILKIQRSKNLHVNIPQKTPHYREIFSK